MSEPLRLNFAPAKMGASACEVRRVTIDQGERIKHKYAVHDHGRPRSSRRDTSRRRSSVTHWMGSRLVR
jgi:hypothetical protein